MSGALQMVGGLATSLFKKKKKELPDPETDVSVGVPKVDDRLDQINRERKLRADQEGKGRAGSILGSGGLG